MWKVLCNFAARLLPNVKTRVGDVDAVCTWKRKAACRVPIASFEAVGWMKAKQKKKIFLYNNSDLCQPVKVEVLNVINCKVWTDIIRPCVSRVDVNPPVFYCLAAKELLWGSRAVSVLFGVNLPLLWNGSCQTGALMLQHRLGVCRNNCVLTYVILPLSLVASVFFIYLCRS